MDIQPDKQSIDKVFAGTPFYIDFYQRQYKWTNVPVERLLNDIFYQFNKSYKEHSGSSLPPKQLVTKYNWYYLNTYVTNAIDDKTYIVDGQQRLTTLTLILIKLKHKAVFSIHLQEWIKGKILGYSGSGIQFWMNHEAHLTTLEDLYEGKPAKEIAIDSGITARNMVSNYETISKFLDKELTSDKRTETFIHYFLQRLVLINLHVEQTDVPMVFEVINDRGVRLKPYEILKGKLLGQVSKEELDSLQLNELWDNQVNAINAFKDDEIDQFFIYYLKAKLADTTAQGKTFDNDYHRAMFTPEVNEVLQLDHNPQRVTDFLLHDFRYFTNLYITLWKWRKEESPQQPFVYFNGLTDMDSQLLLILSACKLDDPDEITKVKEVSYHVDRLFCLLQLQRGYDSNAFNRAIYDISKAIRDNGVESIRTAFDDVLKKLLQNVKSSANGEVLTYGAFKETGIELEKRFKRYFFARIERFISENTQQNMKQSINDLVTKTGSVNGFHIEHILAENDENRQLFGNDPDLFERERNRLGGLLLLKGKDNQSSNNESYSQKLKSYANTLYWNETLREDSYKSKKDFDKMMDTFNLHFEPFNKFGPEELEKRHRLLFEMIAVIWK
ncbi:DUF262 domain-containing protein [Rudanella paleaurantiibacter]|uniref:DUF262 domain-containing protein n=1 Tax=Rudanella paleaurantiibacter TaxID=2614655 RepID=A0A7J5TSW8_9BACT|nr:DUF262 domain-containing protein [Rudanella paleaurantiibacter]KAB7726623.1 DUF262 domain-containing protein [Rudanella paleaurantiibacter]